MKARVKHDEDGVSLMLPREIAEQAQLEPESLVDISVEDGRLIIGSRRPRYTIEELLEGLGDGDPHAEWDTGPPVGREAL